MRPDRRNRLPNAVVGAIVVVVVAIASLYAFTKELPWADRFEVRATFADATNVRATSPVRIAGINVGEVTEVEHLASAEEGVEGSTAAVVTMELEPDALPLREDAILQLRPRLFLEGNVFVELRPGSPQAAEVEDGYSFGVERTATSVKLDRVLTGVLPLAVRSELQGLLDQLGGSLVDEGGARGLRRFYASSPRAFRDSARVAEAFLGTHPHDLSGTIRNLGRVMEGLGGNRPALQSLVTNLRIVTGSLAAEDAALAESIDLLPEVLEESGPALVALNGAFPSVRALAIEALPGVRGAAPALLAATPWARQLEQLVSRRELRGLANDLRPAVPDLVSLTEETASVLGQARALSSCFNEVVVPWSNDSVVDPIQPATGSAYEELGYGLVGVAGESRNHDANGPYIRALAGGGANTVEFPPFAGRPEELVGVTPYPILGAVPSQEASAKTPYRPDVPCETQEPPDMRALVGDPPAQQPTDAFREAGTAAPIAALERQSLAILGDYAEAATLEATGDDRAARRAYARALESQIRREQGPIERLKLAIRALGEGP